MTTNDDRDLKDAFKALGSQVRASAPSFQQLSSRETLNAARWRKRRRRAGRVTVAIGIGAFLAIRGWPERTLDFERFTALTGIDLNEVTWEAPSDFLLDVPGRDLLRRVPLIEIQVPTPTSDSTRPQDSSDSKRRSPS